MSGGQLIRVDFAAGKRIWAPGEKEALKTHSVPGPKVECRATLAPCLRSKLDVFSELIQQNRVRITFRPRFAGVLIPEHLWKEQLVSLDWSMLFGLPDFNYDETGVSGTLSFAGQPFYVSLPWDAVVAMAVAPGGVLTGEPPIFWIDTVGAPPPQLPQGKSNVKTYKQGPQRLGANIFESFFFRLGAATKRIFG